MSESVFLAELRLALGRHPRIFAIRINTGVFRPIHGPQDRRIRSAPNGTPDLLGIAYGRPLAIETKSAKGPQRDAQEKFGAAWTANGGIYILARKEEDVWAALSRELSAETLSR